MKSNDGDVIGHAVVCVEMFTVGSGYLIEPVFVEIKEGENAAKVLDRLLTSNNFDYGKTGTLDSNFYLENIRGDSISSIPTDTSSIPEVLLEHIPEFYERSTPDSLGEFDYTSGSGWMYCVNSVFPNVGFADYYLADGDVMRVQFTLSYGMDIGGSSSMGGGFDDFYKTPDKDDITVFLAKFKQEYGYIPSEYLDVVSRLNIQEIEFDGDYFTEDEIFKLANYYIQMYEDGNYTILDERVPLFDAANKLFAYAVPFVNSSNKHAGHINIGALKNGLPFYLIDSVELNYGNIKNCDSNGNRVKYAVPFTYYYEPNNTGASVAQNYSLNNDKNALQTELTSEEETFTKQEEFFNQENVIKNEILLKEINQQEAGINSMMAAPHTLAGLSSDIASKEYVRIKEGNTIYYGGDQSWWNDKNNSFTSRSGKSGAWLEYRGCGAVAFADNILYHIQKDYKTYYKLLKHNDHQKYNYDFWVGQVPNPDYKNFDDWFAYSNDAIEKTEYLDFLDFYAHLGNIPQIYGTLSIDMEAAYYWLAQYTDYTYILHKPKSQKINDVEMFLVEQLRNDTPVYLQNLLERGVETRYLLNDPVQSSALGISEDANFWLHWMTVTKYFKNGTTGNTHVAFSSWGSRFSINADLLKKKGKYYSDFYAYEILQKQ
ncbi:DUF4430 domain-containing protein [Anaerocolumna sp.]|uniref:DUF4430 domain-containing protein n=1 Tax=Anaerocolumna sp. TaxID=2041569 RepID=UPI0028AC90FA|nr:DUF4430 domain-containing protein [Anaerocolumna sp.]